MPFQAITYDVADGIATITLNRPDRLNAVGRQMKAELFEVWQVFNADPNAVVAILTGAGDRAFCAGADLKEAADRGFQPGQTKWVNPLDNGVVKPVVCAVNGLCAGGALAFVADSDIVVAAEHAVFKDARVSFGVVSIVGTVRLARRVPLGTAMRLALMGKGGELTARRAYDVGLVDELVPGERLLETARRVAGAIAENSPAALIATKRAILDSMDYGLDEALKRSWDAIHAYHSHPDITEGPKAFAEKRKPRWKGPG
jgi:E-phenylitaconyl-CoA hydratase